APGSGARAARARAGTRAADGRAHAPNVRSQLARLQRTHAISTDDYRRYLRSFNDAVNAVKRLSGTRAVELKAVIGNLRAIAADGMLKPSRLRPLFLTLDRNRSWWTTGPLLSPGQRVQFDGSQIAWVYFSNKGMELQQI